MRISRSFLNFALSIFLIAIALSFTGCKGRTLDNVEPTGDTIEVAIGQETGEQN